VLARGNEPVDHWTLDGTPAPRTMGPSPASPVGAFWVACVPSTVHDAAHLIERDQASEPSIAPAGFA
jgi:hypothetical protein